MCSIIVYFINFYSLHSTHSVTFFFRCGHAQDRATRAEDQISPIFLQFLDALWQIYRQNVPYFEFNSRYILTIADHIYSGRFGNFLFGSDCDRVSMMMLV